MFKLESYIAPLLMSYINKYVKLQQEDFTLSLWGGDAVLNKLDLRLDAIESALNLPITFKSGHIYELRIHVPWTKLGSEPVVITINTIECILKLRDSASDDAESTGGTSSSTKTTAVAKPRVKRQDTEDLPPGYLQSLVNRIVNNANIVINNLILKFVEDDIVLSVNVKSAECYSVNSDWKRAFIELAMPELVLRRVFDFNDLTVCLDRRNASGKIETYQDPLLYRCSLTCRIHMIYDSLHAKLPSITRFNLLCERLDLSLTDTQVPMFCRLIELCVALYYGTLEMPGTSATGEDSTTTSTAAQETTGVGVPAMEEGAGGEGWASWAWSYVPQILPSGEEGEDDDEQGPRRKPQPGVLSLGFYIKKASIVFKLTETILDGANYSGSGRVNFVPCVLWEADGVALEVLVRGLVFFNVQFGVTGTNMTSQGDAICGVNDLTGGAREPRFIRSGSCIEEKSHPLIGFMTGSLFDPGGAENQNERPTYIFEEDKHVQRYTETFSLVKYGCFWMDYLYTMEEREERGEGHSSNASQSGSDENIRENSSLRFLFGPTHVTVSSSMVQRLHKFVYCMGCHEYEPYSRPRKEMVDESRPPPTEDQVRLLEEYVPTRTYHVTFTKPVIWVQANDLPSYDIRKRKVISQRKAKKAKTKPGPAPSPAVPPPLPVGVMQAERIDLQLTSAMYPRKLIQQVSKMAAPSSNLLHHCHSHTYIKLFSVQAGISRRETSGKLVPIQNIIQPWSGAWYKRSLLFPMYWKNSLQPRRECMYELPHLTVNLTKPQLLLLIHTALTWAEPGRTSHAPSGSGHAPSGTDHAPSGTGHAPSMTGHAPSAAGNAPSATNVPRAARTGETSLMDDVFKHAELRTSRKRPVLEMSVSGVEVRDCETPAVRAVTGTLTAAQAMLIHVDSGHDSITPLMYGPLDTASVANLDYFNDTETSKVDTPSEDLITFTVQLPATPDMPAAPAVLMLDVRGMAATLDPILYDWLKYIPTTIRPSGHKGATLDPKVNVDPSLAESSSPLKSQGSQSESGRTGPTDSQTVSRTAGLSATKPGTDHMTDPGGEGEAEDSTDHDNKGWPQFLARHFPLVKIMEVQVDLYTCVVFLPARHVRLAEVTMDIPRTLAAAFNAGDLPETLVICGPRLHLHSAGHHGTLKAGTIDIPIRALDQSVSGEKLPWSVDLSHFTIYTLHPGGQRQYVVSPAGMSATIAVTTKYHPPTSDTITALGLCVHADMEPVVVACSHRQIQLLYDLTVAIVTAASKMATSLVDQLGSVRKAEPSVVSSEPARLPPTTSPLKATANNPTMSTSSQLDPPVTITETSDTLSRETTPVRDLEDAAFVKLSLWIQWTLPKFVWATYSLDDTGREIRVVTEIEDVATSIDVQDVYSKVKVKVGMLNVGHEVKDSDDSAWCAGDHEGVLLTSDTKLNQNVLIMANKTWSFHGQPVPNLFTDPEAKPRDKSHGFITVTFTRALRKNVKKRMKRMAQEGFGTEEGSSSSSSRSALVYLNELCVNLQPCDVVVNCPVLSHVIKVYTWRCQPPSGEPDRPMKTPSKDIESDSLDGQPVMPWLTADILPLIYINTSNLRMLVPACNPDVTAGNVQGEVSTDRSPQDVCVVHLRALTLTPIADNPLPRIVLEKEVYRRAMHAGITQQPGSEVEDRQYQLDVAGLSLSTGRWRDLVVDKQTKEEDTLTVQHPALEWNNLLRQRIEKEEVRLTPVATAFDLRVVAAPAVVYRTVSLQGTKQTLLVCGHSLELNATSDINFYLSNTQIKLALDVFSTNVAALLGVAAARKVDRGSGRWERHIEERREDLALNDSGVDSETSTCVAGVQKVPAVLMTAPPETVDVTVEESVQDFSVKALVPFDILLTAGKISFMTYMHESRPMGPAEKATSKVSAEDSNVSHKTKSALEIQMPPIASLLDPVSGLFPPPNISPIPRMDLKQDVELESTLTNTDSGIDLEGQQRSPEGQKPAEGQTQEEEEVVEEELLYVVPFLYATFAQPHTMLKIEHAAQKLELSCYDIILKGAKPGHSFREDQRVMPEVMDYGVHWIETKAGEANQKTGIPPSLYTLRASDFLLGPADLLVQIERPLKVNASITRFEQVMTYLRDLLPYFTDLLPSHSDDTKSPSPQACGEGSSLTPDPQSPTPPGVTLAPLTRLRSVQVVTVQAVLSAETRPDPKSPSVQLSVSHVNANLGVTTNHIGALKGLDLSLNVGDFLVKTGYEGTQRPLLGPVTAQMTVDSGWTAHSGPAQLPALLCCLDAGLVPVCVGQEHVLCLQLLGEHLAQLVQSYQGPTPKEAQPEDPKLSRATPKPARPFHELDLQASVDDLRAGDFEYNTVDSSPDLLPRPHEIVFGVDGEEGRASMTWCYPEPRVVTFLQATPVPFTLPQQLDARFIDEGLKVPCLLQYYSPLCRDFTDYATFTVSQSEAVSVPLREVAADLDPQLAAAQVWRALILHPDDRDVPLQSTEQDEPLEPLVSPMTLAASLRVDSCFTPCLVPVLQLAASAAGIQVRPANHYRHLAKGVPDKLHPYKLDPGFFNHDHELAVVTVDSPTLMLTHVAGKARRLTTEVNASLQCDIIEYRNLTLRPLLEQVDITASATWMFHSEQTVLRCRGEVGPVYVRVGEGAVHTLNMAGKAFSQLSCLSGPCVLPHYYLVCNNTREAVRIAQVGTDEVVTISSHQVAPYGWRSHKIQQLLQLTLEGYGGVWSDPIDIDTVGTSVCVLEHKGQKAMFIVKVKAITGVQKQIEISGTLIVASRLSQHLEVKVVLSKSKEDKVTEGKLKVNEGVSVLGVGSTVPSYVGDPAKAWSARVKLFGLKTVWSQEISVSGEKTKDTRLVKVPLADKGSFVHVWCHIFTESHQGALQYIVLFVPLFTVRTHFPAPLLMNVETPRLRSSQREELKGQGHEEHMFMVGGDMTHNITFQLSPSQHPSSPPIALSSGMIEQVPRVAMETVTADRLLYDWKEDLSKAWPYNDIEEISSTEPVKSPLGSPTSSKPSQQQEVVMAVPPGEGSENQPNIDLQISLKQRWPGCNTLLIDIAPCWMMVNATDLDLMVIENNDHQWRLSGKQTFAPPVFDGPFRLGVIVENRLHMSSPLTLSDQEMTFRYLQGQEDTLYNQGHLKVIIPVVLDKKVTQLCYLTLHSVMSNTMRVVTARETYVFLNNLGLDLHLQGYSLSLSEHKVSLDHESAETLECTTKSRIVPIPIWHQPAQLIDSPDQDPSDIPHVQYICVRKANTTGSKGQEHETSPWALPCRIRLSDQGVRVNLSLPLGGSVFRTAPAVLSVHQRAGLVYLVLGEEVEPSMEIHNNCGFTVAYGQGLLGVQADDKTVQEEAELTTDILTVPPGGSAFYTFPACNSHFPQVSAPPVTPKLHLAGYGDTTEREKRLVWSLGMDLESEHDIFVNIPDVSDAKVHTEKVGHTLHVFIDPVSRAEISAKEIRSRIKGKQTTVVVETKKRKTSESDTVGDPQSPTGTEPKRPAKRKPLHPLLTEAVVVCSYASFILLDEGSNPKVALELLRITADKMSALYFPEGLYDPFQQMRPHLAYKMTLTCGDLQVDNQMFTGQSYDFPVVFKSQADFSGIEFSEAFFQLSPQKQHKAVKETSLITLDMSMCTDLTARVSSLTAINLTLKPVTVYIEDTFVYDTAKRLNRFLTSSLSGRTTKERTDRIVIPREVLYVCSCLNYPVRLKGLVIEPVSLLLSVHASLKLFIASDNTPLSFSQFERKDIFTNSPQLLRAAAMHYASGALYRAGWVVGSLEILGNPTGLVRNVGIGISDMFRMPYQGLTQGPGAFVGGVTRGMGSLVRHISTGALTSVTNFASSVSRNMDRLSLDSVHRARQEEWRRNKPRGVSDGLLNGLSGFGISLLGAVAGIADQPLQTLTFNTDPSNPNPASPTRKATGLVSGVGKGLVGAITKPIGGAAELVSQTGLGLLQGTGLTSFPTPRHHPITEPAAAAPSSTLKVIEKLLSTVPNAQVLAAVDALSVDMRGSAPLQQQQVSLLLTPEILFILSAADDSPLQAYAVSQISCTGSPDDPSHLAIVLGAAPPTPPPSTGEPWVRQLQQGALPEDQMNNKDRVAAFLGGSTGLGHMTPTDQSETSAAKVHSPVVNAHHEFTLDAPSCQLFLSHFSAAKRKATGVGFPI